jgi:ABC-type uncharacterized transport system permease subunit
LLETLVAAGVLVTLLASLAQLIVWSVSQAREAGSRVRAMGAVQDKIEKLRARAWTVDLDGNPVSDPALATSPSGALDVNTSGHVELVGAAGQVVFGPDALVVRRWAVEPIDSIAPDAIAITVCAFRPPASAAQAGADLCLSTVRVRQP